MSTSAAEAAGALIRGKRPQWGGKRAFRLAKRGVADRKEHKDETAQWPGPQAADMPGGHGDLRVFAPLAMTA